MIKKLKAVKGFAKDLPLILALSKKELGSGINILWGANGSGKSTALKFMAAHTQCHSGGWTRLLVPLECGVCDGWKAGKTAARLSPGACESVLDWDRAPVFFDPGGLSPFEPEPGILDSGANLMVEVRHRLNCESSGQLRSRRIAEMRELLASAPDFRQTKLSKRLNSAWEKNFKDQIKWLSELPDSIRLSLLMDEPDKNLDAKAAYELWYQLIPHFAKYVQVIVATHHPFALACSKAVWFEDVKGSADAAREVYKKLSEKLNNEN